MTATIFHIDEAVSTNTLAAASDHPLPFILVAHSQTAGRGQRGNFWESVPGKNLTFSLAITPKNCSMAEQFYISKCTSNAILKTLACYDIQAKVKWPNDIYVGDKKICGILIENSVSGSFRIIKSIIGVGLNVNQDQFKSSAPNPVSMKQLLNKEFDLNVLLADLAAAFEKELARIDEEQFDEIDTFYTDRLYRFGIRAPYKDDNGTFFGKIVAIEPTGELIIEKEDTTRHAYLFKEVEYLIIF